MPRDYVRSRPSSRTNQKPRSSGGIVWLLAGVFIGLVIAGVFYIKNHSAPSSLSQNNNPPISKPSSPQVENKNTQPSSVSNANSGSNTKTSTQSSSKSPPTTTSPAHTDTKNAASENLQTQFDFYNVLPGKNVTGPSGDEDEAAVKPAAQTPAASQNLKPTSETTKKAQIENNGEVDDQNSENNDDVSSKPDNSDDAQTSRDDSSKSSAIPTAQLKDLTPPQQAIKPKGYVLQLGTFSQYADADKLKAQLVLLGFDVKSTSISKNGKTYTRVWLGPFHTEDEASSVNSQLKENNISAKLLKSSS